MSNKNSKNIVRYSGLYKSLVWVAIILVIFLHKRKGKNNEWNIYIFIRCDCRNVRYGNNRYYTESQKK